MRKDDFMKKYLLAGVVMTMFGSSAFADPMVDQVFDPSVRLDAFCSGQIIKSTRDDKTGKVSTYILTAKHCVKDEDQNGVIPIAKDTHDDQLTETGKVVYEAKIFGLSYKSDLALLKLIDENTFFDHTAEIASNDTKLTFGETVDVVGYPVGLSMTWTEGKLGYQEIQPAFKDLSQSRVFYRATPDIAGGSSGSAMYVFDGGKYRIIGILTGGYSKGSFLNYYTPMKEINEYLDTALPKDEKKKEEKVETKKEGAK